MLATIVSFFCLLLVAVVGNPLPSGVVFLSIGGNSGAFPNSICSVSPSGVQDVCDFQATVPSFQYASVMKPIADPTTGILWIYASEPDYLFGCSGDCIGVQQQQRQQ
jgi:hypothetical protein